MASSVRLANPLGLQGADRLPRRIITCGGFFPSRLVALSSV